MPSSFGTSAGNCPFPTDTAMPPLTQTSLSELCLRRCVYPIGNTINSKTRNGPKGTALPEQMSGRGPMTVPR